MSLDGDYDDANIFARMIRGEIPAAKITEDADILAFMDLFPQTPGHCLVISKTARARTLLDVEPAALCSLMEGVQRVARAVRRALQPDGIVVSQHSGASAGQSVFHLHFHLLPRWEGRPLTPHGQTVRSDPGELADTARRIAAALESPLTTPPTRAA